MILKIASACIGSVGFAILLKIRGRQIVYVGIGGAVSWTAYVLMYLLCNSYFTANFTAAIVVAVYAEIMARVNRVPTTIFLTAAAIPLIPGRNLYYTMYGIVSEEYDVALQNGVTASVIALAIGLGFVCVTVALRLIGLITKSKEEKNV